ncbi:DMT family transporter [Alcanivorax sp.]|uniref:EamA family transporter n=1 Tax=Alcanivorax sp. TaxID=1872427 RepID=UPI0025BF1B28|nr:DMT family transporter [Alcanivorax sp.]
MTRISTILVILAALCWGLSGGIGSMLMEEGWGVFLVAFYRGAIGLLFVLAWLCCRPLHHGLGDRRLWGWSVVAGLGVAGNFAFYFLSISRGGVAVAATLMYSAPVFVYLLSFALRLERPSPVKWAAIMVVMLGIVLLTRIHDVNDVGVTVLGVVAGLLSGLCYAVFIFGFKYAAPHGSPQAILSIAFSVLVVVLVWPAQTGEVMAAARSTEWPLFACLGVLGAGLSFVLYVVGLNHTAPAVASIVAMVEPVTASLFGVVVLQEALVASQVLGMGLILVAVTGLSLYSASDALRRHW